MKAKLIVLSAVAIASVAAVSVAQHDQHNDVTARAVAVLMPGQSSHVGGTIWFVQTEAGIYIEGKVNGLPPNSTHGFHIHEFGDVTSPDGLSLGGHFNPMKTPHGLPGHPPIHGGDMGNITADATGTANVDVYLKGVTIGGENSILGRGIVVHEKVDDGGQPTGNAGARIGFGVIGLAITQAP